MLRRIGCVVSHRRRRAPRLDEAVVRGIPGAESAMHRCLVKMGVRERRDSQRTWAWSDDADKRPDGDEGQHSTTIAGTTAEHELDQRPSSTQRSQQ